MKKIITSIILIFMLLGCDNFNETRVCNQTGKEIILKITFDKDVISSWSDGMLVKNVTKTFKNWDENLIPIEIDTINYISTYLLTSDSCGHIEGGNNRRPTFRFYKELEIITTSDTLRLLTKGQMRKAFDADRKDPNYFFDFLLQEDGKHASR